MEKKETGLQKFTDLTKINKLLEKSILTKSDIEILTTNEERDAFNKELNLKMHSLKGLELENFLKQIDGVLSQDSKNMIWEGNHLKITQFIMTYIAEYGQMPNKSLISDGTILSRVTVHKHFKEYSASTVYKEQAEQFKIMRDKVLAKVYQFAVGGDVKACKLFLEATGGLSNDCSNGNTPNKIITVVSNAERQTQNNFIQINNTVLSQDQLRFLEQDQLNQIESIIKSLHKT